MTHTEATTAADVTPLPGADIEPHVVDAEIVDDEQTEPTDAGTAAPSGGRIVLAGEWTGPLVPDWVRDPDVVKGVAKESAKGAGRAAARLPLRYTVASLRGYGRGTAAWWRWVTASREIEAAAKGQGGISLEKANATAGGRWKATGIMAGVLAVGEGLAFVAFGDVALWLPAAASSLPAAAAGWRPRRALEAREEAAAVVGARESSPVLTVDVVTEAVRASGVLKKGQQLSFAGPPTRDRKAGAWEVVFDLPRGTKASALIAANEALASGLGKDEVEIDVSRVRGKGGHAGRVRLWVADEDPYAREPIPSPLAEAESFDFWRPVPYGVDARGQQIDLPLIWTSLLVGAIPRMGKTYAARLLLAAALLDPYTQVHVWDGKGGKDARAAEVAAHRFGRGDAPATVARFADSLEDLERETQRRFDVLGDLDDEVCPEGKVTPAITRDPAMGMPLVLLWIDEGQVYLEDEENGKRILKSLTYLAKKAPAAGIMTVFATQKPDAEVMPDKFRGMFGTRFALKTMTWQASETILGQGTYKAGITSHTLMRRHKGVGILLGNDDESGLSDDDVVTVATHLLGLAEFRDIAARGRELRIAAGTLSGDAADEAAPAPVDRVPAVLRDMLELAGGRARVSSSEIIAALELETNATAFGRQLRRWGCPSGKETVDGAEVRGPATADVRAAVERIEGGGPVEIAEAA